MKKFIQVSAAIKAIGALAFTGQVMMVTVVSIFLGRDSIPVSYILQMILLALIYGGIHLIAFSENMLKKMNTTRRIEFLGKSMLVVLAIFAVIFRWFAINSWVNWLIFIGFYTAVFLIAVFVLRTMFRLSGIKYNEMLSAYKSSRES